MNWPASLSALTRNISYTYIGHDILYIYIILFERSEFLIATSKKKSLRVCSTNLGFSEVRIVYQIRMYLVSAGRNEVGYRKIA